MNRRILIVDDDVVFANTLARSLERKQIEVCVALNKGQALAFASAQTFSDHNAIVAHERRDVGDGGKRD